MVIRINRRETAEGVVVELHGWLSQDVLGEFVGLCDSAGAPLRMDLSNLAGTDDAGLEVLKSRIARGACVEGVSPYIRLLLDSPPALPGDPKEQRRR